MVKYLLYMFNFLVLINGIKIFDKCPPNCVMNIPNCKSRQYSNVNYCFPQFDRNTPPNGCERNKTNHYIGIYEFQYKQYSNVKYDYLCPNNCRINAYVNNNIPICSPYKQVNYYNTQNNFDSNDYKRCKGDLQYDLPEEKGCVVNGNEFTCRPYIDFKCPYGCNYNNKTQKCNPINLKNICNFVSKTLQCPQKCSYNFKYNKCFPDNINYVCDLEKDLFCPNKCNLTPDGKACMDNYGNLCSFVNINPCSKNCTFINSYGRCIPNTVNDICEPMTKVTCKELHYEVDNSIPLCNKFNMDRLCRKSGYLLFPTRLNYPNLKCHYPIKIDCQMMTGMLTKCPGKVNTLYNSCITSNGVIPGTTMSKCPNGYSYTTGHYNGVCLNSNHQYNTITGKNGHNSKFEDFKCDPYYELINVNNFYYCAMSWYLRNN